MEDPLEKGTKAAGGAHHGPPDAPHFIESRCAAVHPCDRPTVCSALTRHVDAADGGTPTIRVDRPRHPTTMSTAFSQDFVQADRLIRRRYVQIPGKQRDLLERPDAWSENLSHGPRGMINVPPEVLQDVKDFHLRRQPKPVQQPNPARPASSAGSGAPPKSSRSRQPQSSPRLADDDQAGDDGATQLSWSPSPSPSRPPPARRPVQLTGHPERASPTTVLPASQPTFLKRKTPPVPLDGCPSSSAAQSDALPYEPLSILGKEPYPPVNRGANRVAATQSTLPAATPPSAQAEVIPSTLMNTGQAGSVAARPFNKRRRLEDIELSDKEHDTAGHTRPLPKSNSKPPSAAPENDGNVSSASVSTPSLPSQAAVVQQQRNSLLQTASAADSNERSSSHYTPTYEGRPRDTPTQQKNVLRHSASGSSMAPAPAQPPAEPAHWGLVKELHSPFAGNTIGHRTPYEEFKAAYPDYEESTRAFIRACLAVEKLQFERALPEFLYDDFVRVHSTIYMDYYGEAQIRKYTEVLKATQWYNENVKDMVYTKKIIRRDNLPAILKAHSTAVNQIRESIRAAIEAPPSNDEAGSEQESDEDMADDGEQGQGEELGPEESEPEDVHGPRLSPEFHVPSPGPAATAKSAVVGKDDLEEVDDTPWSASASRRMGLHTATVEEDHLDDSPRDDTTAPEGFHRSRASSELHTREPETVVDEEAPLKDATRAVERTHPSRKSSNPSRSRRDAHTPADSSIKSASSQRKLLAPLQSPTPSSVRGSVQRPPEDKATSRLTKSTARHSSPAFRSQAESSDDESDSFDPPVEKAAMPSSRSAASNVPAFLSQAQSVYEIPGTPERLSEEPMPPPPPPPKSVARTPAASQPRPAPGQTASAARTAADLNPDEGVRKQVPAREGVASALSTGSSIGARKSPASSDRSRASVPLFKKRAGETKEERSKRFKEHLKKRLSGKTPNSTPASTK